MARVVTAATLSKLLEVRHSRDFFVTECKDGPTWNANPLRLDAWAMRRTWSPPTFFGYEIKVSRSDFVNDEKWRRYLEHCTDFYFVCPRGLIAPEELPEDVGLLWASSTGSKLFTKRKAPHRDIALPARLMMYLLMCRTRVASDVHDVRTELGTAYWEDWLERREANKHLGHAVSLAVREHVDAVNKECRELRAQNELLQGVRKRLVELGHDPEKPVKSWSVEDHMASLTGRVPRQLLSNMRYVSAELSRLVREFEDAQASGSS